MPAQTMTGSPATIQRGLQPLHGLLGVQALVVILVSINRLGSWTLGYVAGNEFLRWVELNNMLILPLISLVAFYLLKKWLEYESPALNSRTHLALNLAFIIGVYLLGASYGDHEVTNYLHFRFCADDQAGDLCRIIIFNDDEFSHWVFFTGFVLVNAALLLFQRLFPWRAPVAGRDVALLIFNGLFIGAGIFANLAFEEIGLDLYVIVLLAVLSLGLLWRSGRQPLFIYYATAYTVGLVATVLYRSVVV
ncbi:MAG: hypothetical protein L0332_08500 [Chloroflexi bacterium]|nr:hypothetical protein [Chloroflexota bacterium]MCI0576359.1 hypothetical protein [Chloroflexota bacterium]MCI0646192.1 hypothetical protein [Chloroflexota bacterium]MCI0726746.1 hypothetical protein [Chloroflexota bacterium]